MDATRRRDADSTQAATLNQRRPRRGPAAAPWRSFVGAGRLEIRGVLVHRGLVTIECDARRSRAAHVVALAAAALLPVLAGCRPLYVAQVGVAHLRYLGRARPISEEIGLLPFEKLLCA